MIKLLNPVEGHIGPPGHIREPASEHRLASGNPCFRVTQTFDSTDGYFKGVAHGAVDIGNYNCGDPAFAPFDGAARSFRDGAGAIGVRIQHSTGWIFEIWHLNSSLVSFNSWVPVRAGQSIGIIGKTGLGAVCHGHLELKKDGKRYDIWPYLNQEASMVVRPTFRRIANRTSVIEASPGRKVNVRDAPDGKILHTLDTARPFMAVGIDAGWYLALCHPRGAGHPQELVYVWHELCGPLKEDQAADCGPVEERIDRGITAIEGAESALTAAKNSLRG